MVINTIPFCSGFQQPCHLKAVFLKAVFETVFLKGDMQHRCCLYKKFSKRLVWTHFMFVCPKARGWRVFKYLRGYLSISCTWVFMVLLYSLLFAFNVFLFYIFLIFWAALKNRVDIFNILNCSIQVWVVIPGLYVLIWLLSGLNLDFIWKLFSLCLGAFLKFWKYCFN